MSEKTTIGIAGFIACLLVGTVMGSHADHAGGVNTPTTEARGGVKPETGLNHLSSIESGKGKSPELQLGKDWIVPGLDMAFVWIQPLGIWVGKYEITNSEYRAFDPGHDSEEYKGHTLNQDRQPVVFISFEDARDYAKWLTKREDNAGRLPTGYHYRLPTRDEWKSACQCEEKSPFPWGDAWPPRSGHAGNYSDRSSAWWNKISGYDDGFPVTCPVEKSWKNKWGLYGMSGNVWECVTAPEDLSQFKSWMGGSWYNCDENDFHPWSHIDASKSFRNPTFGFRLILSPSKTKARAK